MTLQIEHDKWLQPEMVLVKCGSDAYKYLNDPEKVRMEVMAKVLEKHHKVRVWSISAKKTTDSRFRHIRFSGHRITGRKDLDTSMWFFDYGEACEALDYLLGLALFDEARLIEHIADKDDFERFLLDAPAMQIIEKASTNDSEDD